MSNFINSLTAKQKKVHSAIETYIRLNGIPPTVREIGEMVGEKTPGAVQGILNRLEQKGAIKRQLGAARSIQLVSPQDQMYINPVYVPEIKKISKRNINDIANIYNINKYLPVPPDFLPEEGNYIFVNCNDYSLSDSGIIQGDTLLINTTAELLPGDIVLVYYNNQSLLRYYYPDKEDSNTVTLKADLNIIGKEVFNLDEINIVGKLDGKYTKY